MNQMSLDDANERDEDYDEVKTKDYAIILLQIFRFMYHNCEEFRTITNHSDFLSALIITLYPYNELTPQQASTPAPLEIKPFAEAICDAQSKSAYKSYLSVHPARKLVMDFLRDLLYDGMFKKCSRNVHISMVVFFFETTTLIFWTLSIFLFAISQKFQNLTLILIYIKTTFIYYTILAV